MVWLQLLLHDTFLKSVLVFLNLISICYVKSKLIPG